jgi:hypothetical protein
MNDVTKGDRMYHVYAIEYRMSDEMLKQDAVAVDKMGTAAVRAAIDAMMEKHPGAEIESIERKASLCAVVNLGSNT